MFLNLGIEKGTIHTKRHSGEDPSKTSVSKSDSGTNVFNDFAMSRDKSRNTDDLCQLDDVIHIF